MTAQLGDPEWLRSFADSRWSALAGGRPVPAEEIAAMAEAMFRLALHPRSARADAVDLLYRAHRAAPEDARFAYHLGRMALEDDRLSAAEAWLTRAHETEPGNHRIATHLIVALRRLEQAQPAEAAGARVAFRSRSRVLSAAVRAGGAAGCGWAGVYDLEMSAMLPAEVSEQAFDELRPVLTAIRDLADRPGGVRAFAAAAICWLVRGYPLDDVRDLADGLPADDYRASYVLTLTCRLFALPAAELPARLAEVVRRRELPEILVALIHQRRLLADVRAYPRLGALRAAQWFLTDEHPHGSATHHVSVLDEATAALRTPPPVVGRGHGGAGPDRIEAADAVARLTKLETMLGVLDRGRTALSDFIGGPLKAADRAAETGEQRATVAADHALLSRSLDRLTAGAAEAHEQARSLLDNLGHLGAAELGDDFGARADAVRVALADRMAPGKIRRLLARVKNARPGLPGAAASPAAEALAARLGEAGEPAAPAMEEAISPTDVAAAVARAHRAVDEVFSAAEGTLRPYPESATRCHLRGLVLGRRAENLYRMGRTTDGRRTWHRLLADNGPSAAVFRNIAVAALCDGDQRHATEMWRCYAQELSEEADRERLHAVLAAAYLPPGLRRDDAGEAEHAATVHFLTNPRAIRAVTIHLGLRGTGEGREQAIAVKHRIEQALLAEEQWALGTAAIAVIANLTLVDELALDPNDDLTFQAALNIGIGDPATTLTRLNALHDRAIRIALGRILADAARQDESSLPDRHRALLTAWVGSSVPPEESYPLDHPRSLYDQLTRDAIADARQGTPEVPGARQTLVKWCRLIPSATGPFRDLARLAELSGDRERAWRLLLQAVRQGIHPIGLRDAARQAAGVGWKLKRYDELLALLLDVVERAPHEDMWNVVEVWHRNVQIDLCNHARPWAVVARNFERWYKAQAAHREPEFRAAAAKVLENLRKDLR